MNQMYVTWYINWARLVVMGLVPFVAISFLNTKIYIAIRRRRRGRRRREDSMSVVLMIIVMVFTMSNLPRLVLNMHEITVIHQVNRWVLIEQFITNCHRKFIVTFGDLQALLVSFWFRCVETDLGGFPMWSIILGFVSHVMLTLNSSTNLLIYCLVVSRLRKVLTRMLTCSSSSTPISCQCVTDSESEQCPLCGRRLMGLKTIQKSGTDKIERKELGTMLNLLSDGVPKIAPVHWEVTFLMIYFDDNSYLYIYY